MKLDKMSLPFLAFLQATGLLLYIGFVALFFQYGETWFGKIGNYLGPILFLLLFVISAMITGTIVLARSGVLFWEKKYKEAFSLLGYTIGWSIVYLLIVIVALMIY